ncbi:MAG: hypothetical protein FWE04_01305 [Oscillospiraceae bacterium]|nr:hypothetical protein [Oscillospiraceae bacterium]
MYNSKTKDRGVSEAWHFYQKGVDYHEKAAIFSKTERAFKFYEGEQWHQMPEASGNLPILNIIAPVVDYKTAMVAMNNVAIRYSPFHSGIDSKKADKACQKLNSYAAMQWDRNKLDNTCWDVVKQACISGDSYVYFYNGEAEHELIDRTQIFLADEQTPDIQKQKYIIIAERKFVDDIKKEAEANKIPQSEIEKIMADNETNRFTNNNNEVKSEDGKCVSLLMLWKEDGIVHFSRSTRDVVYQTATKIDGLTLYPIANLVWGRKRFSARGTGEVTSVIPNQIEINRGLARRATAVKMAAFPKLAYNSAKIENINDITKIGAAIEVNEGGANSIHNIVSYLTPAPISGDAKVLTDELNFRTRELAGAGDAIIGQINPERASGTAIMAARDQAALPLNRNIAAFRQFVEDIAAIWFNLWVIYNPNGIKFESTDTNGDVYTETITADELNELRVNVRIDIYNNTPFSKFAQEQAVEIALMQGHITFEEYVDALDDNSIAPKGKFERILKNRENHPAMSMQFGLPFEMAEVPMDIMIPPEENFVSSRFEEKFDNLREV